MFEGIAGRFAKKRKAHADALMIERAIVVRCDDDGIAAAYPDGLEKIAWNDVDVVAIETNDSGPWGADVWWLLEGADKRCAYPQCATGDDAALAEFSRRLPAGATR